MSNINEKSAALYKWNAFLQNVILTLESQCDVTLLPERHEKNICSLQIGNWCWTKVWIPLVKFSLVNKHILLEHGLEVTDRSRKESNTATSPKAPHPQAQATVTISGNLGHTLHSLQVDQQLDGVLCWYSLQLSLLWAALAGPCLF